MFIRRLRMAGFKSFADPTILEFDAGVNVIVGPNGSGKSNIADALSWVLGAQAPSALRGASMEDVIFAGSQARPRLAIAEVELTLDNSSRVLPIDLEEVTVTRSTDRAGASEYRINGAVCRLLDIAELLSDTGIGRSLHTVVGQGQLDAVLQARAEERRSFIEEAAQIGKYRRRKDRALRKIERVEDNLVRLNDVLSELTRAIRPLKRQAEAATQYSELVSEQRDLKQRLTATELQRLAQEESVLDPTDAAHKVGLLEDELASIRARLEGAVAERGSLARDADIAQNTAYGIGRAAERLTALGRFATERAAVLQARLSAETEEGYRERIRLLDAERTRWNAGSRQLHERAEEAVRRAARARQELERHRARIETADLQLRAARAAETDAAQAFVRAEGSEAAGRATLGSLEARVQAVVERRELTQRARDQDRAAIDSATKEVRALEQELDRVTEQAAAAEADLEQTRERVDGLRAELGATHATRAAARARVEAFEEVRGLVAEVPRLVSRLDALLVEANEREVVASGNEQDAARIVAEAEAEVERRWGEVARHDEELRRLDALMAGAAERLAGARRRYEAREVEVAALDEELARVRDALASAERAAVEERALLPERKAALDDARGAREEAERALAEARRDADEALRAAGEADVEARAAHERALAAQLRLEEAEAGIADARAALQGLADLRANLEAARDRAQGVARRARAAAATAKAWAAKADERAAQARARAEEAEHRLSSFRARERELEQHLERLARQRSEIEIKRAEMRARAEAVTERAIEEWGLSRDDLLEIPPLDPAAEAEARDRVEHLDRQMRRMGAINPRAAEEYAELAERERFLQAQIEDLRSSKRDLLKIVREVDETIVDAFRTAFTDVAREFEGVFARLFPGGTGRLKLTEPDDLLTTGIEIEARPPGKNVRKISLLSGGERSLVALAFLFAIFRSRPSPFYLLDEVEAALDDINLTRFLGLIHELEERAQVLVVTHQKRTMEAADVLYGVTMNAEGVSRIVARRMEEVVA